MGAVTFTVIVQVPFAGMVTSDTPIDGAPLTKEPPPIGASTVGVPQPAEEYVAGSAVTIKSGVSGRVSVKFSFESEAPLGLFKVKVSAEVPSTFVVLGLNAFEIVTVEGSIIAAKREPKE